MSGENEKISDILHEMRNYTNKCNDGYHTDYGVVQDDMERFADRIEAARKREVAEQDEVVLRLTKSEYSGMREALAEHDRLCEMLSDYRKQVGDAAAARGALETIHDKVNSLDEECGVDPVEIRDIARAALSKPARNCERFSDRYSAFEYFKENELWKYNKGLSPEYWFSEWIFAKEEKERGARLQNVSSPQGEV